MRGTYGQFCPIALGAEIFAERWTPLLLRELLNGSHRFGDLQRGLPNISRNLLTQRLEQLMHAGIVIRTPTTAGHFEYTLTPAGEALRPVVMALGTWGYRWVANSIRPEHLNPELLMWFLRRRLIADQLPPNPVVVRLEYRCSHPRRVFWLILQRPVADLCLKDPGFPVDVDVLADLDAMVAVYLGHTTLAAAIRANTVEMTGSTTARRTFTRCLGISPFASALPARQPQPARPVAIGRGT